ncbi:hypothetical protein JRC04_05085 [Mycolicibacterium sp. S2-37]|uniref:hypothetical protein n=1 Tax=Mycolicibacterium sp. S2-37 TaxID=2810297 RepID=UPI001A93C881|nr:hypothetical protein [Mycolicibacterium sp. S2-37]MBO0676832.1 hypothetical protein [Mycolicibacterium sp. S2-37]
MLNCIECFCRAGIHRDAVFVVNGQSVCQKHISIVIAAMGKTKAYTWALSDSEPVATDSGAIAASA